MIQISLKKELLLRGIKHNFACATTAGDTIIENTILNYKNIVETDKNQFWEIDNRTCISL